jgi:hypothetical protein
LQRELFISAPAGRETSAVSTAGAMRVHHFRQAETILAVALLAAL